MAYTVLKGYEGTIYISDGTDLATVTWNEVGRVESFSVEINQNLERFSQLGTRKTVIVDGQLEVSGSFSRALIDSALMSMATGILTSGGNLGNAEILPQNVNIKAVGLNVSEGREYQFTLIGVTIDGWSMELTPTDIVMEDVDFIARSVQFSDAESLNDGDYKYDATESDAGYFA